MQDQPGSPPLPPPQGKGKCDEHLSAPVLNTLADISPWQQAGSKTMLKTSFAHSSDAASAGARMPNGGWLLAAPLFCQPHCADADLEQAASTHLHQLVYNRGLHYAAYMLDDSFLT